MPTTFRLGRLVATPGALRAITAADIVAIIERHASGDFGDLCEEAPCARLDCGVRAGTHSRTGHDAPESGRAGRQAAGTISAADRPRTPRQRSWIARMRAARRLGVPRTTLQRLLAEKRLAWARIRLALR